MNIILVGYGKMGKAIEEIAVKKGHTICLKIDINNADELNATNVLQADVAIEFTGPHSAFDNVMKCLQLGIPVVCGSTGWLERYEEAKQYCETHNGTLINARNSGLGVNLFFEVNKQLAKLMSQHPDYNVLMEEIHHTQKKDAPSGTAITLAEQILETMPQKKKWVNEFSTDPSVLSIISERIDPAPGTHKVKYSSPIDDIEIIHTAHNRAGFAGGAVLAAEYASTNKGIWSMKDVLGL
ncbi:MAG: 4-hydroxy-tetrahydrodipicolinate reductase [Chitinophagaceae bacterium]|nr:4-hydroxy-tetrahydrodipicolinate reductase [Chitinophagaceae bacterium]